MSILWISGRTSLLGTLFAVLSALAMVAGRSLLAGALLLTALLGKEEPILLPAVFVWWWIVDSRASGSRRHGVAVRLRQIIPSLAAIAVYFALRVRTDAFTPATAPDFYSPSLRFLTANVIQYLDRSLTFAAALLLLGWLATGARAIRLTDGEWRTVWKGLGWLALCFAPTIVLPVRSSLYVCLPSVGAALAAAAIADAEWRVMRRPGLVSPALLLLPLALWPLYAARNGTLRREAELGADTLALVARRVASDNPSRIVVYDDTTQRPSLTDAFANAFPYAVQLAVPGTQGIDITLIPALTAESQIPEEGTLKLVMKDRRLVDP